MKLSKFDQILPFKNKIEHFQTIHCKNFGSFLITLAIDTLPGPAAIMDSTAASITRSHSQPPWETKNPFSHLM